VRLPGAVLTVVTAHAPPDPSSHMFFCGLYRTDLSPGDGMRHAGGSSGEVGPSAGRRRSSLRPPGWLRKLCRKRFLPEWAASGAEGRTFESCRGHRQFMQFKSGFCGSEPGQRVIYVLSGAAAAGLWESAAIRPVIAHALVIRPIRENRPSHTLRRLP